MKHSPLAHLFSLSFGALVTAQTHAPGNIVDKWGSRPLNPVTRGDTNNSPIIYDTRDVRAVENRNAHTIFNVGIDAVTDSFRADLRRTHSLVVRNTVRSQTSVTTRDASNSEQVIHPWTAGANIIFKGSENSNQDGDAQVCVSWDYMPLRDKFRRAYNAIEYFKSYVSVLDNEEVQQKFERELWVEIEEIQSETVEKYQRAFQDAFPHRETEQSPLSPKMESETTEKVQLLVDRLGDVLEKLRSWAAQTGVEGLSRSEIDGVFGEKGKKIWNHQYKKIKAEIDDVVKSFSYKGAALGYVGSVVDGMRGPHKARTAFNLNDFDVDIYVVHPQEWDRVHPVLLRRAPHLVKPDKIFPDSRFTESLSWLGERIGKALGEKLEGKVKNMDKLAATEIILRKENPW